MYCDHKGQSIVEESTSVLTWLVTFIILMATWDWVIANTIFYPLAFLFIILPTLAGIFRI